MTTSGDGAATSLKVLTICGSLRRESYNRKLMRAAIELAPPGFQITESIRIDELPYLNEDVAHAGLPAPVQRINEQVRAADAVVFVTPEYNYGVPGVLKNVLDWITTPHPPHNALRFKPVGLMGASIGNFGTVRCQLALRQTFLFIESYVMPKPEIYLFRAQDKFDTQGRLTDEPARELLKAYWPALRKFAGMIATTPHGEGVHA
jgi:chromate reductase